LLQNGALMKTTDPNPVSGSDAAVPKVLVVEDNPNFEALIGDAILQLAIPHEAVASRTGAQALRHLEDAGARFELVLVDLGLPDMSGVEVIRAAHSRFPDIPIMVISVIAAEEAVLAAIRAGARGYILKGDSQSAMAAAVRDVLAGNYPISPSLARSLFKLAGAPATTDGRNEFNLSPREIETLRHIARGHTYEEVAELMKVALSTVQSNIRNLYRKLDAHSQLQAVSKARDAGII
jgi:DNA-binding NarL/FixJ family response regulator